MLQNALARYLKDNGFPYAESAGAGRPGTDILGTPGVVWENKTARNWDLLAWIRQARAHAKDGDGILPVVVYWPDKIGEGSPECVLAIVPLPDLAALIASERDKS